MSRTDPFYRQDAEDCIRMMRFMSRNVMEEMKTIENCVKVYKKMYPDWETEDEKDHYFFYDVSFIDDAIKEYSRWLKIAADNWEWKIDGRNGG
jgi:alpha/beta superfamily hydrolase